MSRNYITILFVLLIMSFADAQNPLSKLEGSWYVNMTDFKMWLSGKKTNPTSNYWIQTRKGIVGFKDHVIYTRRKKIKKYKGFDKPLNTDGTSFVWRGDGLLFFIKTKWQVIYQNETYTIVHYDKTFATLSGCDVMSRQKNLDESTIANIKVKLKELGITNELTVIKQE